MNLFAISGETLLLCLVAILILTLVFIFSLRIYLARKKKFVKEGKKIRIQNRTKYEELNVFRYRSILLKYGFIISLFAIILAFSWKTSTSTSNIQYSDKVSNLEILEITPRTKERKALPPPLPKKIEDLTTILEQEPLVFEDLEMLEPLVEASSSPALDVKTSVQRILPPPVPSQEPPKKQMPTFEEVKIVDVAEEMPRFPGCETLSTQSEKQSCANQKMLQFIYKNIKYPKLALVNNIEGVVVIRFYVDENGQLQAPEIIKDIGGGCGQEALRVVEKMADLPQAWTPGRQGGRKVKVYFNLPVKFKSL